QHRLKLVTHVRTGNGPIETRYEEAVDRIDELARRLRKAADLRQLEPVDRTPTETPAGTMSRAQFYDAVERAKQSILAGDIYQVQLAQRFTVPVQDEPFDVYRLLRTLNLSTYMYFLH